MLAYADARRNFLSFLATTVEEVDIYSRNFPLITLTNKSQTMKHISITILSFCISLTSMAQTKVPLLWLHDTMKNIQLGITGKHDSTKYDRLVDQGYYEGIQFISNFYCNDMLICVEQVIMFETRDENWVHTLLMNKMGFVPTDSALVKETDYGVLVASITPDEYVVGDDTIKSLDVRIASWIFSEPVNDK